MAINTSENFDENTVPRYHWSGKGMAKRDKGWYVDSRDYDKLLALYRALQPLLYRAIKELAYVHALHGTEQDALVVSSEGKAIINEGMVLLGCKDLSADHLDEPQMTLSEKYGEIEIK